MEQEKIKERIIEINRIIAEEMNPAFGLLNEKIQSLIKERRELIELYIKGENENE